MSSAQLLPAIRDIYRKHPEYFHHAPWELAHGLFSLGYVEDFVDEAGIAAAVDVVCTDWLQWKPAA